MIEGECLKCGQRYYGWALLEPRNQSCSKCGVELLITEDGKTFFKGYSPFEAEKYVIKSPNSVTEPGEEDKGTGIKKD